MSPEYKEWFEKLMALALDKGKCQSVDLMTQYYGPRREIRYGIRVERNGWDHSIYAKNMVDLLQRFEAYLGDCIVIGAD